jgi:SAM-dependent methyltransferase
MTERLEDAPVQEASKPGGGEKVTFSFGQNWSQFVARHLTPQREQVALDSMRSFVGREDLRGLSFLDVGCGSGVFSLAAWRLGARQVASFDVDTFSVRCCELMRERAGSPPNWRIEHGSVLDAEFLSRFERADLVYAWGSLHHTGSMWQAIRNAAALVRPDGLLFLAIYNRVEGPGGSQSWLKIKRLYNRAPVAGKRAMEFLYAVRMDLLPRLLRFQNPARYFREYGELRGMSYWTDVRDWLGGYPYEFADAGEVFRFCRDECHMELENLRSTNTTGTNQFLFRKRG